MGVVALVASLLQQVQVVGDLRSLGLNSESELLNGLVPDPPSGSVLRQWDKTRSLLWQQTDSDFIARPCFVSDGNSAH